MKTSLDRFVTAVVRHPVALSLKGWGRDLVWRVRGERLSNPPVPRSPRTILFVCKGNICRSPFAARLAERLIAERALAAEARVVSAGFEASVDGRSPAAAVEAARDFGVSLDDHRPQALTQALMTEADLIVVTEQPHADRLKTAYPAARDRVFLLPLAASEAVRGRGHRRFNIADPYGQPLAIFQECYRYIDDAVRRLVEAGWPRRPEA